MGGGLFDRIRYTAIPASLGCFGVMLVLLLFMDQGWGILLCAALLGFGFGANFVIYASAISSYFDLAAFPRLYPICFLGYGLAGITGPGIGGFIADATGSYDAALYLSTGMVVVATIVTAAGRRAFDKERVPNEQPLVTLTEKTG